MNQPAKLYIFVHRVSAGFLTFNWASPSVLLDLVVGRQITFGYLRFSGLYFRHILLVRIFSLFSFFFFSFLVQVLRVLKAFFSFSFCPTNIGLWSSASIFNPGTPLMLFFFLLSSPSCPLLQSRRLFLCLSKHLENAKFVVHNAYGCSWTRRALSLTI